MRTPDPTIIRADALSGLAMDTLAAGCAYAARRYAAATTDLGRTRAIRIAERCIAEADRRGFIIRESVVRPGTYVYEARPLAQRGDI
jgi:hypothetical protein